MIEYTQTELRIMTVCSAVGAAFSFLVGGIDNLVVALLILITVDYLTGMFAAWKTGVLSSSRGFDGIKRKITMLVVVVVAAQIDNALGIHSLRSMVIFAYIGNEGLSVTENIDRMGYGEFIPETVRDKLAQLRNEKGGQR